MMLYGVVLGGGGGGGGGALGVVGVVAIPRNSNLLA